MEWERNIGTTDNDTVGKVIELANGHYILTGSFGKDNTYNTANANAVVMELENNGDIVWSMGYTGQGIGRDLAYEVVPVSGGYLVLGRSNSFDTAGEFDAMVWKINSTGSVLWAKQYGENGKDDGFFTISAMNANEFVLGGFTKFPGQDTDLFYQKMDGSGNIYASYLCIQSVPNLVFDAQSTLIDDSNVTISDVSAAVPVTFTSADYNTDCYQVCVTGGGAASITGGGNNASLRVNSENQSLEKGTTKKARVSITTKRPIQGFGFGMSLDNSKFSISKINLIEDGSPMDIAMNKTASSLAAGQVKIIGMMKDYTKESAVNCTNPRPIFEMEGVFKETSNTQGLINLREELVKLEFVADGELLSPEEYEIIVDWAN